LGRRQVVRLRVLAPPFVGSSPSAPVRKIDLIPKKIKRYFTLLLFFYTIKEYLELKKKKMGVNARVVNGGGL
jgi:hypothetical protein